MVKRSKIRVRKVSGVVYFLKRYYGELQLSHIKFKEPKFKKDVLPTKFYFYLTPRQISMLKWPLESKFKCVVKGNKLVIKRVG